MKNVVRDDKIVDSKNVLTEKKMGQCNSLDESSSGPKLTH